MNCNLQSPLLKTSAYLQWNFSYPGKVFDLKDKVSFIVHSKICARQTEESKLCLSLTHGATRRKSVECVLRTNLTGLTCYSRKASGLS